jgi:uncharacterized coiled-coil DUF342 family protein
MPDVDSNGVDILDRFSAYKSRFMQFSVTEDVFNQVVEYIKELRKERDEAIREADELRQESWDHGGLLGYFRRHGND